MKGGVRFGGVVLACVVVASAWAADGAGARAKNVILMVVDGAGYNAWTATSMYEGTAGREFHDSGDWIKLAVSTYPLRSHGAGMVSAGDGDVQLPSMVYDPAKAWNTTPVEGGARGFPYHFAGYRWLRQTSADSASTITAIVGGRKTYNGAINVDGSGRPIEQTLARLAKDAGKRVGIVSSVPFAHATPAAAAGVHNVSRQNVCSIAVQMLTSPLVDVIAGCGNPDFDNNGAPIEDAGSKEYGYVGGKQVWDALTGAGRLKEGDSLCPLDLPGPRTVFKDEIDALEGWHLARSLSDIRALRKGDTPSRLLIVPEIGQVAFPSGSYVTAHEPARVSVGGTLQQERGSRARPEYTSPGYDPLVPTVPSLEALTRVALNALDDEPAGFFLHIEGGAVDWAMHGNQMGRMIEEMIDFKRSVRAAIDWIEAHGGWDRTLMIVTSDHDHLLWGPQSDSLPFQPLQDNGAGELPAYRWLSKSHSNALVPLFARGVGAIRLKRSALGEDPFRGPYLDQTDVYQAIRAAIAHDGDRSIFSDENRRK